MLLVGLLLMLSTEKEFDRSIGVVLKRDGEKLDRHATLAAL